MYIENRYVILSMSCWLLTNIVNNSTCYKKEGFLPVLKQLIKEANFFTREELTEIQRMTSFNCQFKKSKELTDYPRKLSASRYLKLGILPTVIRGRWVLCDWFLQRLPIQPTQAEQLFCTLHSCSACVGWIGGRRKNTTHSTQRHRGAVPRQF